MNTTLSPINFCEATIEKKHQLEAGWIELAGRIKEIRDNKFYEGRWESFEDFLHDPSMGMDKGTASKMITIYEKLVVEYNIPVNEIAQSGGWSKIAEALPVINDVDSAKEWLEKVSTLTKDDLRKEVNEARGKSTKEGIECKHPDTYKVIMTCCRDCDHKEVVKN